MKNSIMDTGDPTNHLKLAYIIGAYPSLTMTFIDREIRALREQGVQIQVVSIRRPLGRLSPEQEELKPDVIYLLPFSISLLIIGHLYFACLHPAAYFGALVYLLTRSHPNLKSRWMTLLHFLEGVHAAYLLRARSCAHIHAHFVDRAAIVALVASRLLGVRYSVTAHARDIYVDPILLPEKLSGAKFVATCTAFNKAHLSKLIQDNLADKISCIYHGLDMANYQPQPLIPNGKPLVISVGQLREKKGFSFLIEACRLLKAWGYEFECQIVGEGPLRGPLEKQIRQYSLEGMVILCGALPHQEVIQKYGQATLFVLPSTPGPDGDRDGIPNVILEALAMTLPVVSTQQSGIPEVIENGHNGLLVPSADAGALAKAMVGLLDNPVLGRQLGERGRQTVAVRFNLEQNVGQLLREFRAATRGAQKR